MSQNQVRLKCENCGKPLGTQEPENVFTFLFDALGSGERCENCNHINPIDNLAELPDYKFDELNEIKQVDSEIENVSAPLDVPAKAFRRNIDRIISFTFLLKWLALTLGELSPGLAPNALKGRSVARDVAIDEAKVWMLKNRRPRKTPDTVVPWVFLYSKMDDLAQFRGTKATGIAIQAIMASMLITAWTAFETLAADLWICAVNDRPSPLAYLTGTRGRISKKAIGRSPRSNEPQEAGGDTKEREATTEETELHIAKSSERQITFGHALGVTEGSFDFSQQMGEIFVASEKIKFDSLQKTREAYSMAFSEKHSIKPWSIDKTLGNQSLDAVSLMRNVLIHKAGRADAIYVKSATNIPLAPKLSINQELLLDGERSRDLINLITMSGVDLIDAVDKWLKSKPKKPPKKKP